tara:strand:- start:358 stop:1086 length:729 start_codon:yes stop_codon:yes gene_type:complete
LKSYNLKYKRFGENSILIEWPSIINESILDNILLLKHELEKKYLKKTHIKNSYNSLLITFQEIKNLKSKISELQEIYTKLKAIKKQIYYKWEIPVCYEIEFENDLDFLEKSLSIKKEEIVYLHHSSDYKLYNLGFLPGFMYLGGLNKKIHHPRKEKPILNVPKGSVGIGGSQTGIYPNESPGGWYIIGNSPINMFNATKRLPCFVKPGDTIKFNPISSAEYELIKIQVESNIYKPIKNRIND